MKEVVLTGLRANGELHLGSYLGAILPMVNLQREHARSRQINMFIPDLHSITTPIAHEELQNNIMANLRTFVAAGLDLQSKSTHLYRQSRIPAHSELAWILDCFTYVGEANRMVEYKEKAARIGNDSVSVGLFNYPVLMAADILLYGAQWVPVGEDQRQHIELTRNLAQRMNKKFGDIFVVPHPTAKQVAFAGRDRAVRIRSLSNPEQKMSKSISDPRGTILLTDTPAAAAKKVMSATTDSIGKVNLDFDNQPGVSNLLQILAILTQQPLTSVAKEWSGQTQYGELKRAVADVVEAFLTDFQAKLKSTDHTAITKKLAASEEAMNLVANKTLHAVQAAVGLR